jgi:hypothetical protein
LVGWKIQRNNLFNIKNNYLKFDKIIVL